jgi:hypothetical protein
MTVLDAAVQAYHDTETLERLLDQTQKELSLRVRELSESEMPEFMSLTGQDPVPGRCHEALRRDGRYLRCIHALDHAGGHEDVTGAVWGTVKESDRCGEPDPRYSAVVREIMLKFSGPDHAPICRRLKGHEGPHENPAKETWEEQGSEKDKPAPPRCLAKNEKLPQRRDGNQSKCQRPKGHSGAHTNAHNEVWGEVVEITMLCRKPTHAGACRKPDGHMGRCSTR